MLLGTGICLVAQREPIVTAKAVATLDRLSGGRFVLGIGFGWNADEIEHHGVDDAASGATSPASTCSRCSELWREDAAEFHGKYVDLAPSWSWPKPAPHGAAARRCSSVARPDRRCSRTSPSTRTVGSRSAAAGSAPRCPSCTRRARPSAAIPRALRIVPFGTIPDAGKLEYYASLGIDEIVLRVPSGTAETVLPLLDEYAGARRYRRSMMVTFAWPPPSHMVCRP